MNYELINQRIRDRLAEIGESSFDVSEAIGKNRNFLNDLMTGKKKSFSADMIPDIARALGCDANYLMCMADNPGKSAPLGVIPVAGSIEPGVWRKVGLDPSVGRPVPMQPDPRYPVEDQQLWLVRGNTLDGIDVREGSAILTTRIRDRESWFHLLIDGDLVIAERTRDGDVMRTLLRVRREAGGIVLTADAGDIDTVVWNTAGGSTGAAELIGVVVQVMRFRSA